MIIGPDSQLLGISQLAVCLLLNTGHLLSEPFITLAGAPNVWRYVQIFEGMGGYIQNGAPTITLLSFLIVLFPHVTVTFPLPWPVFWSHSAEYRCHAYPNGVVSIFFTVLP